MARPQLSHLLLLAGTALLGLHYVPDAVFRPFSERMIPPMTEICDNAIDDDNDGLIDLNDPDCDCPIYVTPSLIPNPSFEDQTCCPADRGSLHCAVGWIQASDATTDLIDTCGWNGFSNLQAPPPPFPDGNAIMGFRNGIPLRMDTGEPQPNWKEYAGACLNRPMLAGVSYRFEFYIGYTPDNSPYTNIVFYGTPTCEALPFGVGDPNFGCPTNDDRWYRMGSANIGNFNGRTSWQLKEIVVTPPRDMAAIAIGPDCNPDNSDIEPYYFFDNLILAEETAFEFSIDGRGNPCVSDYVLTAPVRDTLSYQWYRDGIALVGETGAEVVTNGRHGIYQVRLSGPASCNLLPPFDFTQPILRSSREEVICHEDFYDFHGLTLRETGIYADTLISRFGCDSIVTLSLFRRPAGADSLYVRILPGEVYLNAGRRFSQPGVSDFRLTSPHGCDSLLHLTLDHYRVYIPNAFSPNFDGVNDVFLPEIGEGVTAITELHVFDRWGTRLHDAMDAGGGEARTTPMEWKGEGPAGPVPSGVYLYRVKMLFDDGKQREISGDLLLVR